MRRKEGIDTTRAAREGCGESEGSEGSEGPEGLVLPWARILITWTPKVCKIMAFMAVILGLGLLFYILLGFRYI